MVFITSRRDWARLSRPLAAVLLAVLLAGAFAYLQDRKAGPRTAAGGPAATAVASPPGPSPAMSGGTQGQPGQPAQPAAKPSTPTGKSSPSGVVTLPPLQAVGGAKPLAAAVPASPPQGQDGAIATATVTPAAAAKLAPDAQPAPAAKPAVAAAPLPNPDKVLADAKAKLDAGDYLGVRAALNDSICGDRFAGPAADQARAVQAEANNKLVFSARAFPGDGYAEVARVDANRRLTTIAGQHAVPWELVCRINNTTDRRIRTGQTLKVPFGPFHAVVSKAAYRLDLFLGGLPGDPAALYVSSLHVGLGKENSTPTGLWSVAPKGKMRNPAWTNPRSGEHYDGYDAKNPLGGYWIALTGEAGNAVGQTSYGIHGTIEPDSIGKQASMGCIRLIVDDVKLVYEMLSEGKSRVLVRE